MAASPKVFISYSHDSDPHKAWVYELASQLVKNGVDVVLDQWGVRLGSSLVQFMEKGLSNSDRVLVVCTDNYNKKSNDGLGGVGYEKIVLTGELILNQDTAKFIPCIRGVSAKLKTPTCLSGRAYIDFSIDADFEKCLNQLLHELYGVPLRPKPPMGRNPFEDPTEQSLPSIGSQSSATFFSRRFGHTFPGVEGIEWFKNPAEAVERLRLFFSEPYYFRDARPIWWWRDGDMHIDSFAVLSADTVVMDSQELVIDALAAVNAGSYYQCFLYLKLKASKPSGLNDHSPIDDQIKRRGYAREEFALFRGKPIRRAEYDDGAAVMDGKVVRLAGEAEVRIKYLSDYNMIIAPLDSPINNSRFDQRRVELLNGILRGNVSLEQFTAEVLELPKREPRHR